MGKMKRQRQKFHTSISSKNDAKSDSLQNNLDLSHISPLLRIEDDIFKGLDININNIHTSLLDDDGRSVKSFKSVKSEFGSKILPKKQKLKLRRELFLRKIGNVNQLQKNILNRETQGTKDINNPLGDALPSLKSLLQTASEANRKLGDTSSKIKGIQKANKRRREMINGVNLYKKVLSNEKFKEDAMAAIAEHIKATVNQQK